jgi:uncharacterized protein
MAHPVVHFEIGCRDKSAAEGFYAELFGWQTQPSGPSTMILAETGGIGGHLTSLGHEPFHYVTIYVQVDDVPAALAKAESLGGKRIVPPVEIPQGTFAWFADPDGNTIGLWKPKA